MCLHYWNADNKVYGKILANRLAKTTDTIIHHSQTGFCKGRQLAENIMRINEVMHYCDRKKIEAILISFDFEKAFDNIEWEAIYLALEKFGFGENYVNMVKVLYNQPYCMCIK